MLKEDCFRRGTVIRPLCLNHFLDLDFLEGNYMKKSNYMNHHL